MVASTQSSSFRNNPALVNAMVNGNPQFLNMSWNQFPTVDLDDTDGAWWQEDPGNLFGAGLPGDGNETDLAIRLGATDEDGAYITVGGAGEEITISLYAFKRKTEFGLGRIGQARRRYGLDLVALRGRKPMATLLSIRDMLLDDILDDFTNTTASGGTWSTSSEANHYIRSAIDTAADEVWKRRGYDQDMLDLVIDMVKLREIVNSPEIREKIKYVGPLRDHDAKTVMPAVAEYLGINSIKLVRALKNTGTARGVHIGADAFASTVPLLGYFGSMGESAVTLYCKTPEQAMADQSGTKVYAREVPADARYEKHEVRAMTLERWKINDDYAQEITGT